MQPIDTQGIPDAEIPIRQQDAQFRTLGEVELLQGGSDAILDRLRGNIQAHRDLAVGISQTGQRGHILAARLKRLPFFEESIVGDILSQAGGQEFRDQFVFRTTLIGGQRGECDLETVAHIHVVGAGAGRLAQAYQVQETIPDRHFRDNIRTCVLGQEKRAHIRLSHHLRWVHLPNCENE
jgi:hypothetical protein